MAIIKDRALLNEDGSIPVLLITNCMGIHNDGLEQLENLENYYAGVHAIMDRELSSTSLPNNKLVCNHAKYITDMATGYVHGNPVQYQGDGDDELNDLFTEIDEDSHNLELALDISKFGYGHELVYMDEDGKNFKLATLSPLNSFLVVDNTVEHRPIFGVLYNENRDINDSLKGYNVTVYTDRYIYHYFFKSLTDTSPSLNEELTEEHYFGGVPLIEYKNNKDTFGDFEGVITLIDAYNLLQSDRVNDKEQLVDAILAVTGASLGDDMTEMSNTAKMLKQFKILELPEGGQAQWLVKSLNESETEVLKKSLKDDIHEFSQVPCLTDENFVGNASGVAMKYKLLGFEQLGMTKERYFKQGLRQRFILMNNINAIKAKTFDLKGIDIVMERTLPVDEQSAAQIAQLTDGFLSWETRAKRFDSEINLEDEKKRLDIEKAEAAKRQQEAFGLNIETKQPESDE